MSDSDSSGTARGVAEYSSTGSSSSSDDEGVKTLQFAPVEEEIPVGRGRRSRSNSFASENEFDADNAASEGKPYAQFLQAPASPRASTPTGDDQRAPLSRQTLDTISNLEGAAYPGGRIPHDRTSPSKLLEQEAEDELLMLEQKMHLARKPASGPHKPHKKKSQKKSKAKQEEDELEIRFDYDVKVLMLGDGGVGKTSIMRRYTTKKFETNLLSTTGVDFETQYLKVGDKVVKVQIWDTAGQERFHVITQAYYKGAQGIILVYDASDDTRDSFNHIEYWMDNIQRCAGSSVHKVLAGNKIDLPNAIPKEEGEAMAREYDVPFFPTSAKDGTNVREIFHVLAKRIVKDIEHKRKRLAEGSLTQSKGGGGGATSPMEPPSSEFTVEEWDEKGKKCVIQ